MKRDLVWLNIVSIYLDVALPTMVVHSNVAVVHGLGWPLSGLPMFSPEM
jgi:hypothetical protein